MVGSMTGDLTGRPAASEAMTADTPERAWPVRLRVALVAVLAIGIAIRIVLLPTDGLRDDLDRFVLWVHGIAVGGLGNAYDQQLAFPPVMAYLWGLLALIQPAFQTISDASDPAIRALMKLPASLADIGLALLALYALRDRPGWAVAAAASIMFLPAIFDVSAWWGQYESIYLLFALAAVVFAIEDRIPLAAAALALALMTKPQALPFLVPFAAWFWARGGPRGFVTAAIVGAAVIVVLWLPFVPAGGPLHYLQGVGQYQDQVLSVLSLRAWNLWWIVQSMVGGGQFVSDSDQILGPFTLRHVGYALTALLEVVVFVAVLRDPRPRTFILGLVASALIAFCFLTTMHERYAYGAIIFLLLLIPERRFRWLAATLGVVFSLNLVAAIPPTPEIGDLVPIDGVVGIAGSLAMLAITIVALIWLPRPTGELPEQDHRVAVVSSAGGL